MRTSSTAALLKELTSKKVAPFCTVVTSPDRVRRERALRYLLDHFAGKEYRPRAYSFGEQGRAPVSNLIAEVSEPSLFEPTRFVVLRGIDQARAADVEPLTHLLARPVDGAHLFLVGDGLPNTPTFKKALEKHATVISFEELKGAELRRWTEREMKQGGINDASDALVELVLSCAAEEPGAVAAIIEKLSLYLDGDKATPESLLALIPARSSASDFELADALLSKKYSSTEVLIHTLIAQGSSPFMLLGLLTKTFVTLYRIRSLLDRGVQQQDIRTSLGVSPWLFNRYVPIAKTQTVAMLSSHCDALLRADFRLKDKTLGHDATLSSLARATSGRP